MMEHKIKAPLIRISRKTDTSLKTKIIVKVSVIISAFLLFGLITTLIKPGSFTDFYSSLFLSSFRNTNKFIDTFYQFALLFGVCLCLLPAFSMKFWNLGVSGQVGAGCIGAFSIMIYCAGKMPDFIMIILMLIAAMVCGAIWAAIPAIFKAFFNTNESLFTLMMNYLSLFLLRFFVKFWAVTTPYGNGSGGLKPVKFEFGEWISLNLYTFYIIAAIGILLLAVLLTIYLKKSKHGYEIAVIGGSHNTAKYVGINVKKVIIRTLIVSGLIAGIIAFIYTLAARNLSEGFNDTGYGFSGILTLWCGSFNPILAGLMSFLFVFTNKGVSNAAGDLHISEYLRNIYTSILFLLIIGCEFFINYNIASPRLEEYKEKRRIQKLASEGCDISSDDNKGGN